MGRPIKHSLQEHHSRFQGWLDSVGVHANKHQHTHKTHASSTGALLTVLAVTALLSVGAVLIVSALQSSGLFDARLENSLSLRELSSFLLVFMSLYTFAAILSLMARNFHLRHVPHMVELALMVLLSLVVTTLVFLHVDHDWLWLAVNAALAVVVLLAKQLFRSYSFSGLNFYVATTLSVVVGLVWGAYFIADMDVSMLTRTLILVSLPFMLLTLPSGFLGLLELYDVVCKEQWRRIRSPYPKHLHRKEPFVSLQVPTYSEPPEVVIETLDALAQMHYHNYEVIVIDNNTADEQLWKPVQAHCKRLGKKFRFYHKMNMKGAKAGALNYINEHCDPRTEIIGVIDADYVADPLFLLDLVGYFEDEKLGFIQTPHDYRAWSDNLFLKMCYWEYKGFFHSAMISLNEREAGITVGTMCLIKKQAFDEAGGWSEWCVTEDSELAIRIHDLGYSSIYVGKTYGRGLIPESFEDYKKQRYRWTAGPVQEFRHYAGHFLGLSKRSSKFTFIQRIFHLNHGLGNTLVALNFPLLLLGLATITSMIVQDENVAVPIQMWLAATVALVATPLLTYLLYRVTIKARLKDMIMQMVAVKALSHVVYHSALRTAITGNAKWTRTNKFKTAQSYKSALLATKEEVTIATMLLVFALVAYLLHRKPGLVHMLLLGVVYMAIGFLAAPIMAMIGVWSTRADNDAL